MPALSVSTAAYAPVLAGKTLPAPSRYVRSREDLQTLVTLANGVERAYVRGFRYVYALTWDAMRGADVDLLRAATATFGEVSFRTLDGDTVTVRVDDAPPETARPGTNPVRYAASVTLREPGVRSPFAGP